ncbi:unnamed protein product [Pieris macdunnoughi]|uniref:Uncharacterized protein n=1 Tax=Pieris macdunnoughi TaxID=345717 RepID=A0A821S6G3_9NEOP|nr:unnamed protein product [Pieris macdunnoughi]
MVKFLLRQKRSDTNDRFLELLCVSASGLIDPADGTNTHHDLKRRMCILIYVIEDARTLSAAPALTAVSGVAAVSAVPAVSVTADDPERPCACAGWPRRQPPVHEILRPKPRR